MHPSYCVIGRKAARRGYDVLWNHLEAQADIETCTLVHGVLRLRVGLCRHGYDAGLTSWRLFDPRVRFFDPVRTDLARSDPEVELD
jgi:hypothetical protein